MAILKIESIKKYYEKEVILAGCNLEVKEGELLSIVGQSGSGKTTMLSLMGLLQNPTDGQVVIDGVNTVGLNTEAKAKLRSTYIGFVFQRARLVGALTAIENVLLPAWLLSHKNSLEKRAKDLLTKLGLQNRLDFLPEKLSIGQMRRVALARALLLNPKIILADEPTNDLDPDTANLVFEYLKMARDNGAAVVLVTHDQNYARCAERLVELKDGRLYEQKR